MGKTVSTQTAFASLRRAAGLPEGDRRARPRRAEDGLPSAILHASLDCFVAIDADGLVVEWNSASEETFGYTREQAIGRNLAELIIPPSMRDLHGAAVGRAAHGAGGSGGLLGKRIEQTAVRANGEEFPVELTVTRADGPEPLFVGFLRDISDRRRREAEDALEAQRNELLLDLHRQTLEDDSQESTVRRVGEVLRTELAASSGHIWCFEDDGAVERLAAWGEASDDPPPVPAAEQGVSPIPDGIAIRIPISAEAHGVLAICPAPQELRDNDRFLLGALAQVVGTAINRRRSTDDLERAETRYRELIERLPIVSYLAEYGPTGNWLYVSPQVEELLGYAPEEWLRDRDLWWNRVHPDDRDRVAAEEESCAKDLTPLSLEYRMIARDGRVVWIRDEGSLGRPLEGGTVLVEGVMTDISDRKQAEAELRHRADHDDLTGLPNRRRFEDELWRRRASADCSGAVAVIDVDDLKYVNDSLGHAAGDALLRAVASSLGSVLLPGEFFARFGGDEFTLILGSSDQVEIQSRLNQFVQAVRVRRSRVPARVSIGAVPFDSETESTDEDLMVAADIALHDAKERGGDRHAMYAGSERGRLAWVGKVRAAIDEDRLVLHAQPIVSADTGEQLASELLVRMTDSDGSLLPPAAFLPTAERFGLMPEIDAWVMERAAELAATGVTFMVNLSARSISDPELTGRLSRALARTGADPSRLVFEITETAAATGSDDLQEFGERIERLGCSLAIDDFGTGFGSLTYLKHMPIRFLKIDMEFVRGVSESTADRAIVKSIVTIARSLGMQTIAEGVEDETTLAALRLTGVDYVQGYHLGRPAPIAGA